ncbi:MULTISPECIES: ABC transporter ATP-binding protein [Fructobacillus]|jgi:oligopeptide transport system ATP-binding protein|uniref:ATPase component (AppF) n=1 Tax=Fructobacillus cardui TaxID=2893170 RepID=A0ABM9MU83_9LACO|nr:ATP-binding cassette domain-containing protein [Fructobacillus sp. EFB-N1]KMK53452.1 Oligopeptide transport ATP-binding protein OppF [Fructobacillus sp. EFB-N1]CAK1240467.1 ABC-type oligopeptide transport system [Fructobacillus cardui]CAK1247768.1 ABC-type oligopeptide transport system [Fructobacillus cardui]CAK1248778.1 ABC-type oligopeptide transport system [Fructobacillus cardui]
MQNPDAKKLVEIKDLNLTFNAGKSNATKAIDEISFDIYEGETFGLVGESGSGKTTIGRTILKLYDQDSGTITFDGQDLGQLKKQGMKDFRKQAQMIFQDPQASLNGRLRVEDIIGEGLDQVGYSKKRAEREAKVLELLKLVGLNKDHASRYPHEFSGGQKQRIGIARALAVQPKFIIADEPISALDVSVQAQVVNLLADLQKQNKLTYLFIAHDLAMVKYISDRIGVMHWGKLVELGTADEVYNHPLHPYTKSLLSAVPEPDPIVEKQRVIKPYDASFEKDGQERKMVEVEPGHFVLATPAEAEQYKAEQK